MGKRELKGSIPNFLRLEHQKVPIYLNAELPDWCIPNKRSDTILHCLVKGGSLWEAAQLDCRSYGGSVSKSLFQIETLLKRLEGARGKPYRGRSAYHTLTQLRECWFHLTNRCNLHCTHCMFSSSPNESRGLSMKEVLSAIHEAYSLGCRIFYFTGGEPFTYKDFTSLCDEVLMCRDTHLVILTNGLLIPLHRSWLSKVERDRVHFQISVDGVKKHHDALRGKGAFDKVVASLKLLQEMKCHTSLAMSVFSENVTDMHRIVAMAASLGIGYVHYLWFFQKGKGSHKKSPPIPTIVRELLQAHRKAERYGIRIDNVEIIKSQVFSLPGTRFDLSNAGWESIAVGPEGKLYPSPALVGEKKLMAGHISEGIEKVWRKSPVLMRVRNASLIDHLRYRENPLRFLIGGGDIDHSFIRAGTPTGHDPYLELYNQIVLALLSEEGKRYHSSNTVSLRSRMGERVYECGEGWGESVFTHSNCVLSLPGKDEHSLVQSFYSAVANVPAQEIANPVHYDEQEIVHIPEESRIRSYGCGSPVLDCELKPGETLVDLGCGAGVECFIAAKKVGPEGRVIGIDMADAMLALAEKSKQRVAAHLAYDTIEFKKAYLEQLPLASNTTDVVISNCVINLSPDKRSTFAEISRILKPGGRMVISDIVYDEDIPLAIKYNERLRGECIGGAFKESELFALLGDLNFEAATVKKRFLYREVKGHKFYSITYAAMKPQGAAKKELIYRGPFAALITDEGTVLRRGVKTGVALSAGFYLDESVFAVTRKGEVENVAQKVTCECSAPSAELTQKKQPSIKKPEGCMVCGAEIVYPPKPVQQSCYYCGITMVALTLCSRGHFVCDRCHAQDALSLIKSVCLSSSEKDMIALMKMIRSQRTFPVHGPEHHSLVPAVILTAYRNMGGTIRDDAIEQGIERGSSIPGGSCGFMGACGAAIGVGIAFSVIHNANPYKAKERQLIQTATSEVLSALARYQAPRCCQRDCYLALKETARLSKRALGLKLRADESLPCTQYLQNKQCIKNTCPLWTTTPACC